MAVPQTRQQFIDFCLRKLGAPVIKINVSSDQLSDRVDEALNFYQVYHGDGTEHSYLSYQIQDIDKTNKFITLPAQVVGVSNIFDLTTSYGSNDLFSINYQFAQSDIWNLQSFEMAPYWSIMSNLQFVQDILIGKQPIRYNKNNNKLYIDMNWEKVSTGEYIIIDAYTIVDPETNPTVWSDFWLQRYATALIKRQWGENLLKFTELPMVGGMKLNGMQIFESAMADIEKLETDINTSHNFIHGLSIA